MLESRFFAFENKKIISSGWFTFRSFVLYYFFNFFLFCDKLDMNLPCDAIVSPFEKSSLSTL